MGLKRSVGRAMLRVCTPDEAAFTGVLALFEAFRRLGVSLDLLAVGFLEVPKSKPVICYPAVVIGNAFTYKLDDFKVLGSQKKVDERWIAWVGSISTASSQLTHEELAERAYEASKFTSDAWARRVRVLLREHSIDVPGPGPEGPQ